MSAPTNPLSTLFANIGAAIAPDLSAQAQAASDQLTLAFETLIAEGAIVIALLLIQTALLWKYTHKGE
jgi:hypothetical protein